MESKVLVPPIKIQGIKTKLVPFIQSHISLTPDTLYIEPFLGSAVVPLNLCPQKALLCDKNQHIIEFYSQIQSGQISGVSAREFLEEHGQRLLGEGVGYYIHMREEFNRTGDPLYFLFLNRSGFNGMIRFNRHGELNVPFCQKPNRFSKSYITKICNQIDHAAQVIRNNDWEFRCCSWQDAFAEATDNSLIYLDPPYIGRDTSYVGEWPESEAIQLSEFAHTTPARVYLSMWEENEFRRNEYLYDYWADFQWFEAEHYYHVGAKEINRHPMVEVLAIKP